MTDFQRNEIALRYESIIAEKMKERMSDMGRIGAKMTNNGGGSNEHTPIMPTTKRHELAKIAGTSEGSIQRTKLILDKGTPEQIQRAREGGKVCL